MYVGTEPRRKRKMNDNDNQDAFTARRLVHVMYGSREISEPECFVRALRLASGTLTALAACVRSYSHRISSICPLRCLKMPKLTAVRLRMPGAICCHHLARVFFSASSRTPLGFNHATNSSI